MEPDHAELSLRRQCQLIGLARSTYYYLPASESEFNLQLMRLIDEQYLSTPFYGWPRMTAAHKECTRWPFQSRPNSFTPLSEILSTVFLFRFAQRVNFKIVC